MSHPHLRSRREFLQRGVLSAAGVAMGPVLLSSHVQAAPDDRFELSIHQYSLKPLFEAGTLDTPAYPRFVKDQFHFANVEFATEFCGSLREDPKTADVIRRQSESLGVRHRALLCGGDTALDAPNGVDRQAAMDDHLEWAKVAERLGCECLRVRASSEGNRRSQLTHAADGIGGLCEAMKDSSVSVLIENIAGWSRDPNWLVELVERIGAGRVGLIADFGNFNGDIYAGMQRLLPYAKSICTKSWDFDEDGNETKIDFSRMVDIIRKSGFRGCVAIEYLGKDPIGGVNKTAALIRRFLA